MWLCPLCQDLAAGHTAGEKQEAGRDRLKWGMCCHSKASPFLYVFASWSHLLKIPQSHKRATPGTTYSNTWLRWWHFRTISTPPPSLPLLCISFITCPVLSWLVRDLLLRFWWYLPLHSLPHNSLEIFTVPWVLHTNLSLYKIASSLIAFRVDTSLFCSPGWPAIHGPLASASKCLN